LDDAARAILAAMQTPPPLGAFQKLSEDIRQREIASDDAR
jgi:hypothetical protein